ncbi:MAG: sulfite exporter TauE/SafE family protein [Planctomycetes bacterium]|nr:sulfite exporter TauE/SafE family protein [Planctomycetota bacterium]
MSDPSPPRRATPAVLALWFAAAFVSTVCGIGGGLYAVPILHFLLGLELKTAIATSLPIVMGMTAAGTVAEAVRADSALDWLLVGLLCLGAFVGARLGKSLVDRLSGKTLRSLFVVLLVGMAIKVFRTPGGLELTRGVLALQLSFGDMLLVVLFGFLGGFVAPIFGIGGGLIVVPALYLGLSDVDYLTARACSTAMSTVTSAQLAWMYWREGKLDRRAAKSLGLVALFAGVAGVLAVHQTGWDEVARYLLGITLVVIAARFAWDLYKASLAARRA